MSICSSALSFPTRHPCFICGLTRKIYPTIPFPSSLFHLMTLAPPASLNVYLSVNIMNNVIFIIVLFILAALGLFLIPSLLFRRAVKQVLNIFRRHSAIDARHAKTPEEMGLNPMPSMYRRMFWLRDYKPGALQYLIGVEVILSTEDGKLYLSEEKLANSRFQRPRQPFGI